MSIQSSGTVTVGPVVTRIGVSRKDLESHGVDIDRDFPGSGLENFRQYPVLTEGGWYLVVKHQPTLTTVAKTTGPLLGPITLTSEGLDLD